jgi:hypothetical protein
LFARALPVRISDACKKEFVSALAQVRKDHDLLFDSNGGAIALFSEPLGAATFRTGRWLSDHGTGKVVIEWKITPEGLSVSKVPATSFICSALSS